MCRWPDHWSKTWHQRAVPSQCARQTRHAPPLGSDIPDDGWPPFAHQETTPPWWISWSASTRVRYMPGVCVDGVHAVGHEEYLSTIGRPGQLRDDPGGPNIILPIRRPIAGITADVPDSTSISAVIVNDMYFQVVVGRYTVGNIPTIGRPDGRCCRFSDSAQAGTVGADRVEDEGVRFGIVSVIVWSYYSFVNRKSDVVPVRRPRRRHHRDTTCIRTGDDVALGVALILPHSSRQ